MANPQLKLYLGIDFGTSLTKVCVRGSDIPRRSEIVTFAGSNLNQAMLPTQVGINAEGCLTDVMTKAEWEEHSGKDLSIVDYIKMRLSKLDHEHELFPAAPLPTVQKIDLNRPEAIENLCAYYLSGVIRKAQAWFKSKYPERCTGVELEWHIQLGVPVKHCDSPALARFQKVLQMAWLLTQVSSVTTVRQLMDVTAELRQSPLASAESLCSVKAEIAAAVRSYTEQPTAQQGLKFFFDVGGGTIEGTGFYLRSEGGNLIPDFYFGDVIDLGVSALGGLVSKGRKTSSEEVKQMIEQDSSAIMQRIDVASTGLSVLKAGDHIANKQRVSIEEVTRQLQLNPSEQKHITLRFIQSQRIMHRLVGKTVMQTEAKNPSAFNSDFLEFFVGGGGGQSEFYTSTLLGTYHAFNQRFSRVPPYKLNDLTPPAKERFQMNGVSSEHFHRFIIAYGLSAPGEAEGGLPSAFPVLPSKTIEKDVLDTYDKDIYQ